SAGTGNACKLEGSRCDRFALFDREAGMDELVGVHLIDADQRFAVIYFYQAHFDGAGPDSGRKVSAIRAPVYDWLVYRYLRKKIVDVSILPLGSGQDDCFGKGREAAAHAVELAAIGIRTAKDLQEDS